MIKCIRRSAHDHVQMELLRAPIQPKKCMTSISLEIQDTQCSLTDLPVLQASAENSDDVSLINDDQSREADAGDGPPRNIETIVVRILHSSCAGMSLFAQLRASMSRSESYEGPRDIQGPLDALQSEPESPGTRVGLGVPKGMLPPPLTSCPNRLACTYMYTCTSMGLVSHMIVPCMHIYGHSPWDFAFITPGQEFFILFYSVFDSAESRLAAHAKNFIWLRIP